MPYANTAELPAAVRAKLKGKKLRQWMHVWNSEYKAHADESRAFAAAWAAVKKGLGFEKSDKISKKEAGYCDQTIDSQRCDECTMWRDPNRCTLVRGSIKPGGWCEHYERATVGKAKVMSEDAFSYFLPITKIDKTKQMVYGYASTPTKDGDGEVVTLQAIKSALPDYMVWRNIREMHALKAVGTTEEANIDTKGLWIAAKIVDQGAWEKCETGVYKGFSIGGRKLKKEGNKITELDLTEISVVDRPCNPDATFALAKRQKELGDAQGYLVKGKKLFSPTEKAVIKMAKAVELLAKDGPPAAHDGFSLPAKKAEPNPSPKDKSIENNKAGGAEPNPKVMEKEGEDGAKDIGKDGKPGGEKKPYGDVKYADPGYQEDKKKRYPVDTEKHIRAAWSYINMPKNAAKYSPQQVSRIKSTITSAWKDVIDSAGPPSAKTAKRMKKMTKMAVRDMVALGSDNFLTLRKGKTISPEGNLAKSMDTVASLAYAFGSIRGSQRSLLAEGKREGGDMKDHQLANELGTIAQRLSAVIATKATHEGEEAMDLSDADDLWIQSILGEDFDMDKALQNFGGSGDPLTDALMATLVKAAQPSKAQRMKMAAEEVAKARKAMKECRKAIEDCHKLHKAAYIAKMNKAKTGGKKPNDDDDDDDDGFDHAKVMSKLQKAFDAADRARTFGKAAEENIAKAAGRAGQRGQEVGDPEAGIYEVPAGVKDLSPSAMAGASPGGGASGGQPPLYPSDGSVYPGKAAGGGADLKKFANKDGSISPAVVELLMEKSKSDGELAAFQAGLGANAGGRQRPFVFNPNTIVAGGGAANDIRKAVFEGVDVTAIGSGDERRHTEASAMAIGNYLTAGNFGKSVFDPAFKGAAGAK